jgi:hypothetical protein
MSLLSWPSPMPYEATTQCPRTDRKPRSAHVTALSALDSAWAATAPPVPPPHPTRAEWGDKPIVAPCCSSLAFRLPMAGLAINLVQGIRT